MRFRKKPVEIEAVKWTGDNTEDVRFFVGVRYYLSEVNPPTAAREPGFLLASEVTGVISGDAIVYDRFHDWVPLAVGDWIIRGVKGEFYPCKPDVFAATYEPVVHVGGQSAVIRGDELVVVGSEAAS